MALKITTITRSEPSPILRLFYRSNATTEEEQREERDRRAYRSLLRDSEEKRFSEYTPRMEERNMLFRLRRDGSNKKDERLGSAVSLGFRLTVQGMGECSYGILTYTPNSNERIMETEILIGLGIGHKTGILTITNTL